MRLSCSPPALPGHESAAQTIPSLFDQVQEDWQLVVGSPDVTGVGPEITTSMSPVSDNSMPFVAFDMNYREYPSFQPGGLQLQVWSNQSNSVLGYSTQGTAQFQTSGETVTWTQHMSIDSGGNITYNINSGQSTTWGKFGQGNGLLGVTYSTTLNSLAGYTPAASITNSAVSWESNYVTSMTLVQVRYYYKGQLISTDTTSRSIPLSK